MENIYVFSIIIFGISISGILLFVLYNPFIICLGKLIRERDINNCLSEAPLLSLVIAGHNSEKLIVDKIQNSLSLNYPIDKLEVIFYSDGSTDGTEKKISTFSDRRFRYLSSNTHDGKHCAINKAVIEAKGEIVVFTDIDAILDSDALNNIIKYFNNPKVGGACGQKIICEDQNKLKEAQSDYIKFDSLIKKSETKIGSITSNEGKLCAIRRNLFLPIPAGVTDDLYICLSTVKQKYLFSFATDAKAFIKVPSRNPVHEINRRRRIVTRDLSGVYYMRELLNPLKYYFFSFRLIINKIVRRLLPFNLLFLFFSSLFLSFSLNSIRVLFGLQVAFYAGAFSYWILFQHIKSFSFIKRLTSPMFYFCIGNIGTLAGVIDFLMGKKIVKWEPKKTD